ncbi:amidohydrolase [Parahaliea mediterranea]|uniref:Amidohydrolase n=1 Tax=Parahaliea mediterranea TaxID=651086 RepID=A0A939DDG6_9GAMM|nr:amidohydrolase [Parahaliea mediterranea]MBN7796168.1 amidohydrolase [Parahaliea mediterranea]
MKRIFVTLLGLFLLVLAADKVMNRFGKSADTVLFNGKIYTVDPDRPWADAVAIKNGKIQEVGSNDSVRQLANWRTETVDLEGRVVIPGLHDAHIHLLVGAIQQKINCSLTPGSGVDEIVAQLKACQQAGKVTDGWLIGSSYRPDVFPGGIPENSELNEHFPDTPVFLSDYSVHNGLANDRALERLGITKDTPNPPGGEYGVDPATGELNGFLLEAAYTEAFSRLPLPSPVSLFRATKTIMRDLNETGTTSVQEALAIGPFVKLLKLMDTFGQVSLSIDTHLVGRAKEGTAYDDQQELDAQINERGKYASKNIHVDNVKLFLDGVPLPPKPTDSKLDPDTGLPDKRHLLIPQSELLALYRKYDALGIKIKTHAVGSGAARVVMNTLDEVRALNGNSGIYHDIAHGQSVMEYDSERAARNNTAIEFSPTFWATGADPGPGVEFNFKTAIGSGALITAGTDWPIGELSNLFPAISGMMANGNESIALEQAIEIFTINGARSVGRSKQEGSISKGKWGTLIVLDRDIFESTPEQVSATKVLRTVFKGETVYLAQP